MRYTTWDKEKLKDLKERIILTDSNSNLALRELDKIESITNDNIICFDTIPNFEEKINDDLIISGLYQDFNDDIITASDLRFYLPRIDNLYINETTIPLSVLMSFVHDFYNSIDKEIAHLFNRTYKERTKNLMFSEERGLNVFLPDSRYSFIRVNRNETIEDFDQIVHEYGHSVSDLIKYHDEGTYYPFSELAPIFFHLISFDYLKDNYENIAEDCHNYKIANSRMYLTYASQIKILTEYLDYINEIPSKRKAIREISKNYHISRMDSKILLDNSHEERYVYSIAFLTAIELYSLYKQDPEKALYTLKQIIKLENKELYNKELNKLNINLNEHSKEYIKSLKKY